MYLSLFITLDILNNWEDIDKRKYIFLSVIMAISCLFKPSFMQVYGLALVIFCVLYTLFTKWRFLKCSIAFAVACIPTLLIMIIQYMISYMGMFHGEVENGNSIQFGFLYVWETLTDNVLGSTILSIAFPLYIFIIFVKETIINPRMQLAFSIVVSGMGCFSCLYNVQGTFCADFAWGAYLAVAAVFLISIIELEKNKGLIVRYHIGQVLLALHFVCGFLYWINVYAFRRYDVGLFDLFNALRNYLYML